MNKLFWFVSLDTVPLSVCFAPPIYSALGEFELEPVLCYWVLEHLMHRNLQVGQMMAQNSVVGQLTPKNLKYLELKWLILQSLMVHWSVQRNLEEGGMVQQIFRPVGQEMLEAAWK